MEKVPKNPEQNQQIDREEKIQSFLSKKSDITPILQFDLDMLQNILAQSADISDEDFKKITGINKSDVNYYDISRYSQKSELPLNKINAIEAKSLIKQSVVLDYPKNDMDTVTLGSQVVIEYTSLNGDVEKETYIIAGFDHGNYGDLLTARIDSTVSKCLFGLKIGDKAQLPNGTTSIKIIDIEQVG